jgi:hypothetical protein
MPGLNSSQDDILAGRAALQMAAWADARSAFERVLSAAESPEAHDGLGLALWWLNEIDAAHRHRATAYRIFKESGQTGRSCAELVAAPEQDLLINDWMAVTAAQYVYRLLHRQPITSFVSYVSADGMSVRSLPICRDDLLTYLRVEA